MEEKEIEQQVMAEFEKILDEITTCENVIKNRFLDEIDYRDYARYTSKMYDIEKNDFEKKTEYLKSFGKGMLKAVVYEQSFLRFVVRSYCISLYISQHFDGNFSPRIHFRFFKDVVDQYNQTKRTEHEDNEKTTELTKKTMENFVEYFKKRQEELSKENHCHCQK